MKSTTLIMLLALFLLSGCGGPSGGGSLTIHQRTVAHGIDKDGLAFVIYTDIPGLDTETRSKGKSGISSSSQEGSIVPKSGLRVDYTCDSVRIKIGEQEYPLAKGRVFLVATGEGKLDVQQLDVPVEPTDLSSEALRAEILRLAEDEKVKKFMVP
jgi:hypothetical protein